MVAVPTLTDVGVELEDDVLAVKSPGQFVKKCLAAYSRLEAPTPVTQLKSP